MNIELKRFTTNARLSRETVAFVADVWVDGRKAGHATNEGHGGSTSVQLDSSIRDALEAYCKVLVPAEYVGLVGGAEWVVDQLVEAELQKRERQAFDKLVAKADVEERGCWEKLGLRAARFRYDDTWHWFGFRDGSNPEVTAKAIALNHKIYVHELVIL